MQRFFNRELSWLEFNQRVLEEALDASNPLLERLKFLAITASNLDEFFRVRVGGLQMLAREKNRKRDPSGMTPGAQLDAISVRVHRMAADQQRCWLADLEPALAAAGLRRTRPSAFGDEQEERVRQVFDGEIYAILSPVAVTSDADAFPLLGHSRLSIAVRLEPAAGETAVRHAVIPLGPGLGRFVTLRSETGAEFVLLEDVVASHVHRFFEGETVLECVPFRVTRNADLGVSEDQAGDLLSQMAEVLDARREANCARLEIGAEASTELREFLRTTLGIHEGDVFALEGPLGFADFFALTEVAGFDELRPEPWPPLASPWIDRSQPIMDVVSRGDVLLYHPYDSFEPVQRFVEEAADDPDVLAIKQTLYRTSRDSPIVAALARAAERGKHVTALVELKARFDEARNIHWARNLEQAGVQVVYGVKGLKTHAKICLVVRREPHGIQRYVHFGTGNYNESTARVYTDASLLTTNEQLGADASRFFNAVTGYSQPHGFEELDVAPLGLRDKVVELIGAEVARARHRQPARIDAKLNSLVDPTIIEALYEASEAGVRIRLNIRGICCLRPGVPGLSENIEVIGIVDRLLEHARILHFLHGGEERVYISSADWMPRNLDRRVELLVPVHDRRCKRRLIEVMETNLRDTAKARRLLPDGGHERVTPPRGERPFRSQAALYEAARQAVREAELAQPTMFEPHRAEDDGA